MDEYYGEDDSFYAELKRQILLLTEDGDEFTTTHSRNFGNSNNIGFTDMKTRRSYFDWTEYEKTNHSIPVCILNLWRYGNSVGTGVFIPSIVKSRKRNKPRRRRNDRGRMLSQRQVNNWSA